MTVVARHDAWQAGDSYDAYMGRWSRQIAPRFLAWLDAPDDADWLEVGCGTGALSAAILARCAPKSLLATDASAGFIAAARRKVTDERVTFEVADAQRLPQTDASRDAIASGLVLNFIPDPPRALAEMRRIARPRARVGFYVWDYPGGGMEMMRWFWTAATALDPQAADLTEQRRFPFCTPDGLTRLAETAAISSVEITAIEVATRFASFEDFWTPFTMGAGPAPGYCASLPSDAQARLRDNLQAGLPREADGSIPLKARAWAVKGLFR